MKSMTAFCKSPLRRPSFLALQWIFFGGMRAAAAFSQLPPSNTDVVYTLREDLRPTAVEQTHF